MSLIKHPGRKCSFPGEFQFLWLSFSPRWRLTFPPRHLRKVSISHQLLNKNNRNTIINININKTYDHTIISYMYPLLIPHPPTTTTTKTKINLNVSMRVLMVLFYVEMERLITEINFTVLMCALIVFFYLEIKRLMWLRSTKNSILYVGKKCSMPFLPKKQRFLKVIFVSF